MIENSQTPGRPRWLTYVRTSSSANDESLGSGGSPRRRRPVMREAMMPTQATPAKRSSVSSGGSSLPSSSAFARQWANSTSWAVLPLRPWLAGKRPGPVRRLVDGPRLADRGVEEVDAAHTPIVPGSAATGFRQTRSSAIPAAIATPPAISQALRCSERSTTAKSTAKNGCRFA